MKFRSYRSPLMEYMLVAYGYEELIGIHGAKSSQERIIEELSSYNIKAILEVSTKTILLLKSWGVANKKIQLIILKNFFPEKFKSMVDRLKELNPGDNWIFFNEHTVLILIKLSILFGKNGDGLSIKSHKEKNDFGTWLLMLNNLTTKSDTKHLSQKNLIEQRTSLRRALAKYQFNRIDERLSFKLVRYKYIFDYLKRNHINKIDVGDFFKQASGTSYETYLSVTFSLIVYAVNQTAKEIKVEEVNKKWLICLKSYLKDTSFRKKTIDLVASNLIGEQDVLKNFLNNEIGSEGSVDDNFFYDMRIFSRYPLIGELDSGCVVLTDPRFLFDRASEGAYWIVENYLYENSQKKLREIHSEIWGYGFDSYVRYLLRNTFEKSFKTNLNSGNYEMTDGLIISSNFVFVIENKHHHWRYLAKTTGKETEMKTTLENLFSSKKKKKGLGQISNFIKKIKSKEWELEFDISDKVFVPTLVVSEGIPMDSYSRKLYEDKAKESGSFIAGEDVMPFIVMTAEDMEMLSCIAESNGVETAAEILAGYSASFILQTDEGYSYNSLPFKSYLHYIKQEVPEGKFLRNKFDLLTSRLEKRMFSKEKREEYDSKRENH